MAMPRTAAAKLWTTAVDMVSVRDDIQESEAWTTYMTMNELLQAKTLVDAALQKKGWVCSWTLLELKAAKLIRDQVDILARKSQRTGLPDPLFAIASKLK